MRKREYHNIIYPSKRTNHNIFSQPSQGISGFLFTDTRIYTEELGISSVVLLVTIHRAEFSNLQEDDGPNGRLLNFTREELQKLI